MTAFLPQNDWAEVRSLCWFLPKPLTSVGSGVGLPPFKIQGTGSFPKWKWIQMLCLKTLMSVKYSLLFWESLEAQKNCLLTSCVIKTDLVHSSFVRTCGVNQA